MPCCAVCKNPVYQAVNRWILLFLTVLSWIFSIVTLASCSFIVLEFPGSGEPDNRFGLFYVEYAGEECTPWGDFDVELGPSHKTARAFGLIACLSLSFALIGICLVIFLLKDKFARIVWLITRLQYPIAFVGTLLTFSFWGEFDECGDEDYYECKPGAAGTLAGINVFVLIGMISVSWFIPIPDEPLCCSKGGCDCCGTYGAQSDAHTKPVGPITQSVVRTIENTPGGRQVTEEVTNADGSKTVTKTITKDPTIEQTGENEEVETSVPFECSPNVDAGENAKDGLSVSALATLMGKAFVNSTLRTMKEESIERIFDTVNQIGAEDSECLGDFDGEDICEQYSENNE